VFVPSSVRLLVSWPPTSQPAICGRMRFSAVDGRWRMLRTDVVVGAVWVTRQLHTGPANLDRVEVRDPL
jgi:hypothetical protein